MRDIQEVFNQIRDKKKQKRDLNAMYKDALASNSEYKEICEELEVFKTKKKQIEELAREEMGSNFNKLCEIKSDIESDQAMLSDIAVTTLMKGETIEVVDENNSKYEPVFKVNFKKA